MYKALINFQDGENGNPYRDKRGVIYKTGSDYPAKGVDVPQEHIDYLLSSKNKTGRPVIKKAKE